MVLYSPALQTVISMDGNEMLVKIELSNCPKKLTRESLLDNGFRA
jgi:hypothetical protein